MTDAADGQGSPRTTVLLCGDLEALGDGLSLQEVRRWLRAVVPGVCVHIVSDLCEHPEKIAPPLAADAASRLVLGLCSRVRRRAEVQALVRRAGLDALGVEVTNLGDYAARVHPKPQATEKAKILMAGAVAKARAFAGSWPENLKPVLPAAVSRRALFSLALLEYEPVPAIQVDHCRAEHGCRRCARACPHEALRVADGEIRLEKARCTGCGVCVTACPHEAMEFPGCTPAQLSAQIAALLDTGPVDLDPRGIIFVCHNSAAMLEALARRGTAYPAHWLPVEVPCLGMVPPTWPLACLALNAAAVGVLPCADGCRSGQRESTEGGVAYCRELLQRLGEPGERVALFPTDSEQGLIEALHSVAAHGRPIQVPAVPNPFAHGSRSKVLLRLAQHYGAVENVSLFHPYSPFGVIDVADGCTYCGACAAACPSGALVLDCRDEEMNLGFDATRCVACGECLPACPEEGVLQLRRITDFQRLAREKAVVARGRYQRCAACGKPIASTAMLTRIAALLGDGGADTAAVISRYCPDCRLVVTGTQAGRTDGTHARPDGSVGADGGQQRR